VGARWYAGSMKQILHYNIILRPEPEGGFTVTVPALPGCVTYGKDLDEARRMAKEAIELYIEDLKARKDEIPNGRDYLISSLEVVSV